MNMQLSIIDQRFIWIRQDFDDCIENVHKTRIGRTSDLLNEIDNQEFAKAMNDGILGLSLPEKLDLTIIAMKVILY